MKFEICVGRDGGRYDCGETIEFIPLLSDGPAPVRTGLVDYKLFHDDAVPVTTGTVDLAAARPVIPAPAVAPGFVQCEAVARDMPDAAAACAAAVAPEQIRPAVARPSDFDAFWQARLADLAAVPAAEEIRPVPCDFTELFDVRVRSRGAPVSGYFARPCGMPGRLPALVQFQGAGVKTAFSDMPVLWADRGFLALNINAHGLPNGQPDDFYHDLAAGALADYRYHGMESRDSYYMLGMFLRAKRALDFMAARPEWDGRNLFVMGHSQGAYQAIAASYLDNRVTALAAGVPAGCDLNGADVGRCEGWPKISTVFNAPGRDAKKIRAMAPYFDNAHFLAAVRCPAIFSVGWRDKSCRPTTVHAAINGYAGEHKTVLDRPGMGHEAPRDVRAAFAEFLLAQVR